MKLMHLGMCSCPVSHKTVHQNTQAHERMPGGEVGGVQLTPVGQLHAWSPPLTPAEELGLLGGKDQTQLTAHFLQPGEPWQECPGPWSEGLGLCVWVTTTPLEITLPGQKEAEVGITQKSHALRCTEPCVFKGLKELFPHVPLRGGKCCSNKNWLQLCLPSPLVT